VKSYISEDRITLQAERLQVLKEHGFESEEYFNALVSNVRSLHELMTAPQIEILKKVNVSSDCYTHSYENHIGSEQNIDAEFIHKNLQILYFYPFKSAGNMEQAKAEAFAI
jgi:hypothetical protein